MKWSISILLGLFSCSLLADDFHVRLDWGEPRSLGTLVSGVIQQVHIQPGQRVKKGDLLISLEDQEFTTEVERQKARLAHARSLLEEAQREQARAQELYDQGLLADHKLQLADIALLEAQADMAQARSQWLQARLRLRRSRILSPFDGLILQVLTWPGQAVSNHFQVQPLALMVQTGQLKFSLPLPDKPSSKKVQLLIEGQWVTPEWVVVTPMDEPPNQWLLEGVISHPGARPGQQVTLRMK